ncbi:MAG: exopolysaccharide biosynthesis polyprenyl glycosylphosphotransferase [Brevundimonas sp.]
MAAMLSTQTRPDDAPADAAPATLDAAGLQALASGALARGAGKADARARRGPFRPEVWLNARQRHASRLAAHWFRAIDALAVIALTLLCAGAASPGGLIHAPLSTLLPFALGAAALLSALKGSGVYGFARNRRLAVHMGRVSAAVAGAGLAAALTALLTAAPALTAVLVWSGLNLIVLYALHMAWSDRVRRWRADGTLTPNVVVVGATKHAEKLIREALQRRDLNVLGVFDDRLARAPDSVEGVPVLGDTGALMTHRMTPYVDHIVLAVDPSARERVRELMRRLGSLPNEVTLLVDPRAEEDRNAALEKLARAPLASLSNPDPDRAAFNKRLQDLIIGGLMLIGLTPVFAVVALLVRLDSPGPILFRQRRHGFNNEEIVVWKFRSMRHEAADATASRQVTADDDRITRVGRFLRATSLDELPQLINVLKGEMSLVGPRPHAIGMKTGQIESARLVAEYAHRHRIKPGMTGWAAVKGSRGPLHTAAEVRRRVQLDVEYVERQSFWLDLWIMAVTVPVLLGDRVAVR